MVALRFLLWRPPAAPENEGRRHASSHPSGNLAGRVPWNLYRIAHAYRPGRREPASLLSESAHSLGASGFGAHGAAGACAVPLLPPRPFSREAAARLRTAPAKTSAHRPSSIFRCAPRRAAEEVTVTEPKDDLSHAQTGVAALVACVVQTLNESDPSFQQRFLDRLAGISSLPRQFCGPGNSGA